MQHFVLTGFMAAGKTTAGRCLARHLGLEYFDTDELIVNRWGKSISAIFADEGEAFFRRLEREIFASLLENQSETAVIATGGGMIINFPKIAADHIVIFLDSDFDLIYERLCESESGRPLARSKGRVELKKLFDERRPIYLDAADYRVKDQAELLDLAENLMKRK